MDIIGHKHSNKSRNYVSSDTLGSINKSNMDVEGESAMDLVAAEESDSVLIS